jgi:hypothetical protein
MIEITTATIKEISKGWPYEVSYKGAEFFHTFYDELEKITDNVFSASYAGFESWQEVYVGWDPATDIFVVGWDAWLPNQGGSGSLIQRFEFFKNNLYCHQEPKDFDHLFYPATYETIHEFLYPDIKDLRLD